MKNHKNKCICFAMFLLVLCVSSLFGQRDSCLFLEYNSSFDLPKTGVGFYAFSEIHLDNLHRLYTKKSIKNEFEMRSIFYENFYKYLYDSCDVRMFVFEAPIGFEYNFNSYIRTGDEYWLRVIRNYEDVKTQLKTIRSINSKMSNDIKIFCISTEHKASYKNLLGSIFNLLVYERIGVKADDIDKKGFELLFSDFLNNLMIPNEDSLFCKDILRDVMSATKKPSNSNCERLYIGLLDMHERPSVSECFKIILGDRFNEFLRLSKAFSDYHTRDKLEYEYMSYRDSFMLQQLELLLRSENKYNYFGLFGYSHFAIDANDTEALLFKLNKSADRPFSIYFGLLYHKNFYFHYPEFLNIYYKESFTKGVSRKNPQRALFPDVIVVF